MLIVLVGPKGSGKSHIGRLLEKHLEVVFFHVEPWWMAYYARCRAAGTQAAIAEGIEYVHPHLAETLRKHAQVCVETTSASSEILQRLLALQPRSRTRVIKVDAPLELCLRRIASRDQTDQIPMDTESIRAVHALSVAAPIAPDLTLHDENLPARRSLRRV